MTNLQEIIDSMLVWQSSYTWVSLVLLIILLLWTWFRFFPKSWIIVIIELMFEKTYDFFEEILWVEEKKWIKLYIVTMFFIIIISNLLWVFLEFLMPIFWHGMEHYVKIPTADVNFNIAMAIIWVIIVILEQFKALGFWKAMGEYVPIFWKNLIPYEKWKMPPVLDNVVFWLVKIFDITISLFLWILEVIWHFAKIISLSFRLFWNMTSGWILLWMLIAATSAASIYLIKIEFPVILPVILYLQEILVAFIQALVFPLLIAIFIKVAKVH